MNSKLLFFDLKGSLKGRESKQYCSSRLDRMKLESKLSDLNNKNCLKEKNLIKLDSVLNNALLSFPVELCSEYKNIILLDS